MAFAENCAEGKQKRVLKRILREDEMNLTLSANIQLYLLKCIRFFVFYVPTIDKNNIQGSKRLWCTLCYGCR